MQGNPLGRKFKALVGHGGTFFGDAKISTEELWLIEHEVGPYIFSIQHSRSLCRWVGGYVVPVVDYNP